MLLDTDNSGLSQSRKELSKPFFISVGSLELYSCSDTHRCYMAPSKHEMQVQDEVQLLLDRAEVVLKPLK